MIIEPHPFAAEEYANCTRCSLCETRERLVLGVGNHYADVMFFGPGPGPSEDDEGLPFVGPSGALLNRVLKLMEWSRDEVFLDNVVACWPCQETEERWITRAPTKEEIMQCRLRVTETIRLIDPLVIVALGPRALYGLTGDPTNIAKARGRLYYANIPGVVKNICYPVFPTFHPSHILSMNKRENAGEIDGDAAPVRGPESPMRLFKKDLIYVRNYLRSVTALYRR